MSRFSSKNFPVAIEPLDIAVFKTWAGTSGALNFNDARMTHRESQKSDKNALIMAWETVTKLNPPIQS